MSLSYFKDNIEMSEIFLFFPRVRVKLRVLQPNPSPVRRPWAHSTAASLNKSMCQTLNDTYVTQLVSPSKISRVISCSTKQKFRKLDCRGGFSHSHGPRRSKRSIPPRLQPRPPVVLCGSQFSFLSDDPELTYGTEKRRVHHCLLSLISWLLRSQPPPGSPQRKTPRRHLCRALAPPKTWKVLYKPDFSLLDLFLYERSPVGLGLSLFQNFFGEDVTVEGSFCLTDFELIRRILFCLDTSSYSVSTEYTY